VGIQKAVQKLSDDSFSPGAPQALLEWARQQVIQSPEFVARAAIKSLGATDITASLGRITMPTLVVVGDMDVVTPPEESRTLNEGIPNSKLVVLEKTGHFSMLEQPAAFNRALRAFLDEL
jgi:3-oxoadipate enol-lactonase